MGPLIDARQFEKVQKILESAVMQVESKDLNDSIAKQLVHKTLLYKVSSLRQLSTSDFVSRIEACTPYLREEHRLLLKSRYRMNAKSER